METMAALPPAVSGNVWPQSALSNNIENLQLPGLTVVVVAVRVAQI